MVRQLHKGMADGVLGNDELSDALPISKGAKQVCVLALILFSLIFTAMPSNVLHDFDAALHM